MTAQKYISVIAVFSCVWNRSKVNYEVQVPIQQIIGPAAAGSDT